jgi:acyl-CoA reductase-like NAD-dependent aldehyde dehydrogenase
MSPASETSAPIRHADRFFIGGQWVAPSSDATINVIDSGTEETYFTVAEAQAADISSSSRDGPRDTRTPSSSTVAASWPRSRVLR